MCQSEATPSSALYWHMGETTIRFASSRSASRIGENRALGMSHGIMLQGVGGERQHRGGRVDPASKPIPNGPGDRNLETGYFRPPCGAPRPDRARAARQRLCRRAWERSAPRTRRRGWPRACGGGTAPRCNNASSARCGRVRRNALGDGRPDRAISARPDRGRARVAVPTWKKPQVPANPARAWSRHGCDHAIGGGGAVFGCAQLSHPNRASFARFARHCGAEVTGKREMRAAGATHGCPQKLTRPDGEIRAGRRSAQGIGGA